MTAGPGGRDPRQGRQPPQHDPPAPSPGGYRPAPAAPGLPAGPAPVRPDTVRFGVGAFIANLLLGLVGSVVTFADLDPVIDAALAGGGAELSEDGVRTVLIVTGVVATAFAVLEVLFLWFAWQGRNWARVVLLVLGAIAVVSGLSAMAQPSTGFLTALAVCQMLLAVVGIVLLSRRPSTEWYAAMTARRRAGLR
ncbi:hypothetical protein [Geodermatophilus marinus]|uniref:hypothetical protein n=1 Tax=Geodermatophilus sp. LHW52908 TaxID=2303986 RepID=UPI000E3D3FED|nr:hypothetical protein [Geodermatophilus sp. LHW52908]RFU23163.1 hypothetical protein D0Z06_00440 [Geodermatophilus sp. LHW52908]